MTLIGHLLRVKVVLYFVKDDRGGGYVKEKSFKKNEKLFLKPKKPLFGKKFNKT